MAVVQIRKNNYNCFFCFFLLFATSFLQANARCVEFTAFPVDSKLQQEARSNILSIVALFLQKDRDKLATYFHPRLKITAAQLENHFYFIEELTGKPSAGSVFKSWYIENPEQKAQYLSCDDGDIQVLTHYGYPVQVAFWLQFAGEKNIVRSSISLVSKEGKWFIGSLKSQRASFYENNAYGWFSLSLEKNNPFEFFLLSDIAYKLSDFSPFIKQKISSNIKREQDKRFSSDQFLQAVKNFLVPFSIYSAQAAFIEGGVGLKIDVIVEKKISAEKIEENCQNILTIIRKTGKFPFLSSLFIRHLFLQPSQNLPIELSSRSYVF